jgi:exonuclease SbcD
MKILHTSDLHLGLSLNTVSFIDDQREMIKSLINIIKSNSVNAVLICGDIFDRSVSTAAAITLYNDMCKRICLDLNVPVLICAGNHDGAARLASCSDLLRRSGLYIAGRIIDRTPLVEFADTAFHFMPYFTIDEVKSMFPRQGIKNYAGAVKRYVESIELVKNKRNILLTHMFVAGSQTCDSDKNAYVGGTSAVPVGLFEKFDYVALGHLHKPQTIKNARYSGTPLKYSFSEVKHKKSATIIDTIDMSIKTAEILPVRDMRVIKGTYDEVTEFAETDMKRDDYIKIELTDRFPSAVIDKQFTEIYPNLLRCTGKSVISKQNAVSVTADELSGMTVMDVLARYCSEVAELQLDDEMIGWFNEAVTKVDGKGGNV